MIVSINDINNALDLLQKDTKDDFDCLQYLAVAMANDAELCRRAEGYDKKPMLEPADISPRMKPVEFLALKEAVAQAIELGYKQEIIDEDEEVDLGLEELRKKAPAGSGNQTISTLPQLICAYLGQNLAGRLPAYSSTWRRFGQSVICQKERIFKEYFLLFSLCCCIMQSKEGEKNGPSC